jgi:glycosyltransferase involved in cell wall biosynthesis
MRDALTLLSIIPVRKYRHIFLLNDPVAATYLNNKFATSKFRYLPDPFLPLAEHKKNGANIKETLGISDETKVFLHFGSMSYRKGTLNILRAIALLPEEDLKGRCFVFAGKVHDDIKAAFYALTEALKDRAQIRIFDTFCTPAFLSSLCETCSVILAPYYNTSFSSGIAGYAANFHKPVAVPGEKFIGKLVKRYRLGYLLKDNSPETIAGFIKNTLSFRPIDGSRYMNTHAVSDFAQKTLLFETK